MCRIFFLFGVLLICFSCFSQESRTDTTLLIVGEFNLKNNLVRNIQVNLYTNNVRVDSIITAGNQAFGFYLKRNLVYTIEILKEGCVRKIIGVSTKLADDVQMKPYFKFYFQTPLEKMTKKNANKYVPGVFEFPTAIILYNDVTGQFDYGVDSETIDKEKKKHSKDK